MASRTVTQTRVRATRCVQSLKGALQRRQNRYLDLTRQQSTWFVDGVRVACRTQLPPKHLLYPLYSPCMQYARHWLGPTFHMAIRGDAPGRGGATCLRKPPAHSRWLERAFTNAPFR